MNNVLLSHANKILQSTSKIRFAKYKPHKNFHLYGTSSQSYSGSNQATQTMKGIPYFVVLPPTIS